MSPPPISSGQKKRNLTFIIAISHLLQMNQVFPKMQRESECVLKYHSLLFTQDKEIDDIFKISSFGGNTWVQGSHISGLTKFHDISMIFPGFVKKIPGIFPIIFRPQITFGEMFMQSFIQTSMYNSCSTQN